MATTPLLIQRDRSEPLYRQIEAGIRSAVLDGRLPPGTRLPSVRSLARELGVARITVVTAYDQLSAEGYIEGHAGAGTRVASELPEPWRQVRERSIRRRRARLSGARMPEPSRYAFRTPFYESPPPFPRAVRYYDLATGSTSLDLFPARTWERFLTTAWRQLAASPTGYGNDYRHPAGDPLLREAIATYLGAARAVRCTPDDVIITAGAQGAIKNAARLWLDRGRRCIVEDPGRPHLWRTFQVTGAEVSAVPVDNSGMRLDALPKRAALALVTPSWQYPAGGTLPLKRRLGLLAWARAATAIVIEDDCDSELRYEGHPLPSLQGLDDEGRVLYVGTFSKVMFPGLRTGYAVAPDRVAPLFRAMVEANDRGPGAIEQRALALFILEGEFERHLRRLRKRFAERQQAMLEAVRRHLGGLISLSPSPAGTHLIGIVTDPAWTASDLADVAARGGVELEPLGLSRMHPAPDRELILQYARHEPLQIEAAVRLLARLFDDAARRRVRRPA